MLAQAQVEGLFGPMSYTNPVFLLMVYAPALTALAMILKHHGLRGLGRFLTRFRLWRMPVGWWAFLILAIPAIYDIAAALMGGAGPFPFDPWVQVFPALLTALLVGPIEELGWRGVALPLLQRRFRPLWASLVLGVLVGVWHLPSFFLSGTPQSAWSVWPFFLGVVAISVILTAMFNASGGSLLVAALFHAQVNGPIWPDAQPWDMWLFVAAAIVVAVVCRRSMLSPATAATVVVPTSRSRHD